MQKQALLQRLWNTLFWNNDFRSLNDPSIPLSSKNIDTIFDNPYKNESGVVVNENTALTFAAVYRAVVLRSDTIAGMPLHVYENTKSGKQVAVNHPADFLLSREPNDNHTAFIYKQTSQGHQDLYGNSYSKIYFDSKGDPELLEILDPSTVDVKKQNGRLYYIVKDKEGRINETLTSDKVLHVPNFGFNGFVGKGIVQMASESMGSALAQQKFGARFFKNNAQPSGILRSQNATQEQAIDSKKAWKKANMGQNQGGTAVLRGDWEYKTITIPPDQAQFLQSREFSVVEVARWFGVEPHLLFDLRKTSYNSIEQQSIEFAVYTVMGICKRWEQELDRKLFSLKDRKSNRFYTKFNINSLLRADIKSRADWYRTMIQNGVMEINEVRRLEDMNATDYGDISFIQKNMQPLNKAEALADKELQG